MYTDNHTPVVCEMAILAHAINAMIPATREPGKKIAATNATKKDAQPAALMISFRILHEIALHQ
jgi:hypothetical protein